VRDFDALRRLLGVLVAAGVFRRDENGRYDPTPDSELLRSDHPQSQRVLLEVTPGDEHYDAWGEIETAIRTGGTAFDGRHGHSLVEHYRSHPTRDARSPTQ